MKIYTSILFFLIFGLLGIEVYGQQVIDEAVLSSCEVVNMKGINTPEFEFSPSFYGEGIAFVYTLKKKKGFFDLKINTSFFDLGFYFPDNSAFPFDSTQKLYRFDEELNSDFHEGPLCFFEDEICYFTREDADKKKSKRRGGKSVLQILKSRNHRNNWSESEVLSFCDKNYNYCHPTISEDGNTMIFASDQPGGYGKMDLYLTTKENNKWSEPYNLGANINSPKNDWFPFYYKDNKLFFASDKHGGKGGLDIYVSSLDGYSWTLAERLPEPINSNKDDFGFILRPEAKDGYFSSARPGGKGNDDIYRFKTESSIMFHDNKVEFMFTLIDSIDNTPLSEVQMHSTAIKTKDRVFDIENYNINLLKSKQKDNLLLELSPKGLNEADVILSNDFGKLWGVLDNNGPVILTFFKDGYQDHSIVFDPKSSEQQEDIKLIKDVKLSQNSVVTTQNIVITNILSDNIYIPTESGEKITFNNIYYDYNKSNIRGGAAVELDALARVMILNTDMKIILNAHTDSSGRDSYNLLLSQKRADSAMRYLVRKGVSEDRIIAIGIGEAEILNHCINGVNCSEREHKMNRRTELEIL